MSVTVPERAPVADGGGWQLADYARQIASSRTDNTGAGTVTFPALDAGRRWEITRAAITCSGVVSPLPTCRLYVVPAGQSPAQQYEVSGTVSGLFDESDYPGEGLWVLEGEQLLAVWSGAPANAGIVVNLQVHVMTKVGR